MRRGVTMADAPWQVVESGDHRRHPFGELEQVPPETIVDGGGDGGVSPELVVGLHRQVEVDDLAEEQIADAAVAEAEFLDRTRPAPCAAEAPERHRSPVVAAAIPRVDVDDLVHPDSDPIRRLVDGMDARHPQVAGQLVADAGSVHARFVAPVQRNQRRFAVLLGDDLEVGRLGCRVQRLGDQRPRRAVGQCARVSIEGVCGHVVDAMAHWPS